MNIFEIFSYGLGRIRETNMSSVLGFIMDERGTHGYKREALGCFLDPIKEQLFRAISAQDSRRVNTSVDVRAFLGSLSRIGIEFELACKSADSQGITAASSLGNKRRGDQQRKLDLVISFYVKDATQRDQEKINLVVAIENKIRSESADDPEQLVDEYKYLRKKVPNSTPIIFIYLTPDPILEDEPLWKALSELPRQATDQIASYAWKGVINDNVGVVTCGSIRKIIMELLRREREGEINPASSHADLLLRSMMRFIDNNFEPELFSVDSEGADYAARYNQKSGDFFGDKGKWASSEICNAAIKINMELQGCLKEEISRIRNDGRTVHLASYSTENRYACFAAPSADAQPNKHSSGRIYTIFADVSGDNELLISFGFPDGESGLIGVAKNLDRAIRLDVENRKLKVTVPINYVVGSQALSDGLRDALGYIAKRAFCAAIAEIR